MRNYILSLLLLISTSISAQYQPSGSKVRYINGIGLGSKLDAAFGTADSLVLYTKLDSTLMFKYKGTARALAYAETWYNVADTTKSYKPIIWVDSVWMWRGKGTPVQSVALGYRTLFKNIYTPDMFTPYAGGDMNVAVGYKALMENTDGRRNTAIGATAMSLTTTGNYNTAIGAVSMYNNTTGVGNVGLGVQTLQYNTTGSYNTALGTSALLYNTTADYNVAIGRQSMLNSSTGYNNVAVGYSTLYSNTTGYHNVILGSSTGYDLTTGYHNTFLGRNTGNGITTGHSNTIIGAQVTGLAADLTGNIILADGLGNRRINVAATGNVLINKDTDDSTAKLQVEGNIKTSGVAYIGTNLVMNGVSAYYADFRNTNYIRFSSSGGTTQRGYIQHNGTDMTFNNDIAGVFLFNKGISVTGAVTTSSDIVWSNNSGYGLKGSDGVRYLAYTTSSGAELGYGASQSRLYHNTSSALFTTAGGIVNTSSRLNVNGATDNSAKALNVNGVFGISALNTAPSSASDTGVTGEIRWDANYMYVCVATNTWKRSAIATW